MTTNLTNLTNRAGLFDKDVSEQEVSMGFHDFLIKQHRLTTRGYDRPRSQFLKLIYMWCGDFPRGNISWDEAEAYLRSCDFSEERIRNAKSLYREWQKKVTA